MWGSLFRLPPGFRQALSAGAENACGVGGYYARRRFGNPAIEETSRQSICTLLPVCPNRYFVPLTEPVTVIPVAPVYS